MKQTRLLMGMPITVEIVDETKQKEIDTVFDYFIAIDNRFSTYKKDSEITKINRGEITEKEYSDEMRTVFALSEKTKRETNGYFDINCNGMYDPSGLVKGWAIYNAAKQLQEKGYHNFYIDAGGDIEVAGHNSQGKKWRVGIRNPFNRNENVKIVDVSNQGIATSGTAIRGQHIYNPHEFQNQILNQVQDDKRIVSLTVIGPNVYEADRFATAAFAMGHSGIHFIESLNGFEGYMIEKNGKATMTSGFERFVF